MPYSKDDAAILVEQLLCYALENQLIREEDVIFTRNQLLDLLKIPQPHCAAPSPEKYSIPETATPILEKLLDWAVENGLLPDNTTTFRDLFDTKIMGLLTPKPSEVIDRFNRIKNENGVKAATDDFYRMCQKTNYIRVDRIARNLKWEYRSDFGILEITINLTKPEKDPREIAALKNAPQIGYPRCLLCKENVGYSGRINHPARQNLRTIPLRLQGEKWYFQYSPYVYYNQHCIVFYEEHTPMKITKKTFARLFDFLDYFPHYFIGSNADLPIVGGSILSHDHFQGGYHKFPMQKAPIEYEVKSEDYPQIQAGVVRWPMSVLRLRCRETEPLVEVADHLLAIWREYSDPSVDILAYSENEDGEKIPHNTITPIARKNKDGLFELDLVFRNNRTSKEHPMGIFHPHKELHHIKKENIGLIEVMGLFILPGRLDRELSAIKEYLVGKKTFDENEISSEDHPLHKHLPWIKELLATWGNSLSESEATDVIHKAVGEKCLQVLHHAGVFKTTKEGREAFNRFLQKAGFKVK